MDPSKINLSNVTKLFEYEKISREIEQCDDLDDLKNIAKSYTKLYFAQQEAILQLDAWV
jgi:hypothetical protein